MMVDVTLVWIPGHCDIQYNDIVDHCAKSATLDPDNIPSTFVTTDACKKTYFKAVSSTMANQMAESKHREGYFRHYATSGS